MVARALPQIPKQLFTAQKMDWQFILMEYGDLNMILFSVREAQCQELRAHHVGYVVLATLSTWAVRVQARPIARLERSSRAAQSTT